MTEKRVKQKTFLIIGLGFMGGCLAIDLRKRFSGCRILSVSRNQSALQFAKRKKWIDEGFSEFKAAVSSSDFIIICTPVNVISKIAKIIDLYARPGTLVTDMGSTKSFVLAQPRFKNIKFVGSHPMAGSHHKGVQCAHGNLFADSLVFVAPGIKETGKSVAAFVSFWKKMGAQTLVVSPKNHDKIVSEISHLPHALAAVLVQSISKNMFPFAATGFRDSTRVAMGDPEIWAPIFIENRKNLIKNIQNFKCFLNQFELYLKHKNTKSLFQFLKTASDKRHGLCCKCL